MALPWRVGMPLPGPGTPGGIATIKKLLLCDFNVPIFVHTAILFGSSILVGGYWVYVQNHALQIPLVHYINDPSLYPDDPFAATLRYYASPVWYLVALGQRLIPLEPLLFTLFLLERLLVLSAAGYLARTFAPQSRLAVVAAMALFALGPAGPNLGGDNTLVVNNFEQTGLSIAFFLLAFAAFYRRHVWLVALWTAIGFNCNSMLGAYALTYLGAVFLLDARYRREWRKWLLAFGLFLLVASPAIALTLPAFARRASDEALWYTASQVRLPHHLFPHAWNSGEFVKFGALLLLLLALLRQDKYKVEQLGRHCGIWAAVSVLWVGYAFVAAYVTKLPSMLVMQPARGVILWHGVASIALVCVCAANVESTSGSRRRAFLAAVLGASILIWRPMGEPYVLAVGLIALSSQVVWRYVFGNGDRKRLALLLTLGVFLIGVTEFHARWGKTGSRQLALMTSGPPARIAEVAHWARATTAIESVFLVDPGWNWQYFRAQSTRPVFTNWKDGSAILWDRTFVRPWVERLSALGLDVTEEGLTFGKATDRLERLYEQLSDDDVERLKSRFKIEYWVVSAERPSSFPVAFRNQSYKVLSLRE
jgi:hypothetical protein